MINNKMLDLTFNTSFKLLIVITFIAIITNPGFSEGTKELRPAESNRGSLHLSKKSQFTPFGLYGAPPSQQIKIKIADVKETIYLGLNNRNEDGDFIEDILYRIVSPSGTVVFSSEIFDSGEGFISNWSEAVAGPLELGNTGGYDAIEIPVNETGDYIIEFNIDTLSETDAEVQIHLFDITVASEDEAVKKGRLHSQGWQLSTGHPDNSFFGKVYPYDNSGVLYEVDLNRIKPYSFVINFNSTGTGSSGNLLEDRKSKVGNHSLPEFDVFFNPPDESLYPSNVVEITLIGDAVRLECDETNYCINFSSNSPGDLYGFIDVNNTETYEENIDIIFEESFESAGSKCIPWNGKDALGNNPTNNQVKVFATFGYSAMHFPIYDAEHNRNGFKVKVVRPLNAETPLLFWDDSEITTGTALDSLTNLEGCNSEDQGCHKWEDRGEFETGSAPQETINTWWYNKVLYEKVIVNLNEKGPVIESLSTTPTSCNIENGEAKVTMPDNGIDYIFSWNSEPFSQNEKKVLGAGAHNLKVKAVGSSCITDTSFQIFSAGYKELFSITSDFCNAQNGSIELNISYPDSKILWADSNTNSKIRTNLSGGVYYFSVSEHPDDFCLIDTFAVVSKENYKLNPDFSFEPTSSSNEIHPGRPIVFKILSPENVDSCFWEFGNGNEIVSEKSPVHIFYGDENQLVSLLVKDSSGCTGAVSKELTIKRGEPCKVTLPDVFSPNSDGINDDLGILGPAVSISLTIYNQWGEVLFYSENMEERWDGKFQGKSVPSASYPYILNYECSEPDGLKTTKSAIGEVTIIR